MRLATFSLAGLLLASTLAAAPAHAEHNELSLGGSTRSLRSSSANAVTAENLGGGELTYARELPLQLRDIAIWGVGTFATADVQGQMFQTLQTDVSSSTFAAGVRARYALHRLLAAHARVDLGMAHTTLELVDTAGRTLSDGSWHGVASGALGADLFVVNQKRFQLGLRLEVGYVAASAVELAPREAEPSDDTIMLPVNDASLGSLDLGGRFVAGSLVLGF